MANRLAKEQSPYLLQHKNQPVSWYPWCQEAFAQAAAEDKPIFLSIGYSTCHWCHVMAHESFDDPEIADLLDAYVCIKVDREERPDIDSVYMAVCQALTGSGGWPLTIFLTPDQKPFFAGTYFPKQNRYGQQGLADLLRQISYLWKQERQKLLDSSEKITSFLRQQTPAESGQPNPDCLRQGYHSLCRSFDPEWGGFGTAPKFPTPQNLLFLMRIYEREQLPEALHMAEQTLNAMANGGIFDCIGGGFSRYSTDQKWLIPHFEKMLYDNALLMIAYLEAFQITKNPFYADVVKQTAHYILTELTDPSGGFYCGQDADSDGVEGKYYGFTPDEVLRVLGEADGTEFCRLYHITQSGNFEGKSIPNRIQPTGKTWPAEDPRLNRLYEYRKKRTKLHLDHKILLSWNAWTIIALTRAGLILQDDRYTNAAVTAHRFIRTNMTDPDNRLFLRSCNREAAYAGLLDDYATYALALIELYRSTFQIHYLQEAIVRANQMLTWFEDTENGGYYQTAHDAEGLIARPKETYDGAIPSGNAVAEQVLEMLASLTGQPQLRAAADRQHAFMAGQIREYPAAHCFSLLALDDALAPHKELLVAGHQPPQELFSYLRDHPAHPISILFKSPENESILAEAAPFTASYPITDRPIWYLCENGTCQAPQSDFSRLQLS